jgi:C4-dicarboxylate transporter DctQ subunit
MPSRLLHALAVTHDGVTRAGFALAAALVALIACSFSYEVTARYVFNAPTEWASPLVSYSLLAAIFLAMPELTRHGAHISINALLDALSPARAKTMYQVIRALAAGACLLAAWFCADETLNQFRLEIFTSPPFAIPKWMVSVFVPYGFLSSGLYFVRQLATGAPAPAAVGDQL